MRLRLSNTIIYIFVVTLGVLLVLLPIHAFISTWGGTAIGPYLVWKGWKEILLLALVPLVIVYLVLRPDVFKVLWARWINKLIALYLLINVVWAFLSPASMQAVLAGLAFNLRFLAAFVLAQIVMSSGLPLLHKLKKFVAQWLLTVTVVLSVLAIVQVAFLPTDFLAQFGYNKETTIAPYILLDENQNALRAFATMRGPNELGSYLLLPLLLALGLLIKERRNILAGVALGLGSAALLLTGSRSAWLGVGLAMAVLAVLWLPKKRLQKWIIIGAVPTLVVAGVGFWLATTIPTLRLAIFHSSPGDQLLEGSTEKHWQATYAGVQDALASPMGQGVGTAGPASYYGETNPKIAENYYVQIAQEVGIFGLVIFLAINALLAVRLWHDRSQLWPKLLLASLAGLSLVNIFLHGWVDDPTAMTWWLVAGLFAFAPSLNNSSKIREA
jgi:hypothetical protein